LSGSALIYGNVSTIGATSISGGLTVANGVNVTSGQFNLHSGLVGVADMNTGSVVGGFKRLTVTAPLCTASSHVFLTYAGIANPGVLSSESVVNGSFEIVSNNTSDAGNVRWLIIN
jgi:hypothetical protein